MERTYLLVGGLLMLAVPRQALRWMLSNGEYGDTFPRFAGALTVGLGIVVVQTIRHRLTALYPTLIGVRAFFCACYLALFLEARDPLFLVLLGMVGFGAVMTSISWLKERRTLAPA